MKETGKPRKDGQQHRKVSPQKSFFVLVQVLKDTTGILSPHHPRKWSHRDMCLHAVGPAVYLNISDSQTGQVSELLQAVPETPFLSAHLQGPLGLVLGGGVLCPVFHIHTTALLSPCISLK